MKKLGLYFHFPFCESKCAYCDFYSITGYNNVREYINALMLQCEDYAEAAKEYVVDSVFFGGGTPTIVPEKMMLELIDSIYDNFNVDVDAEFTIEANPATVDLSMLKKYKKAGINRISFGLQSAVNAELEVLSRIHTFEEFVDSYNAARKAGFDNINIDLMYGIPKQTVESLQYTLENVLRLEPEHISFYNLKIEPSTPFAAIKDSLALPDEDTEFSMYEYAIGFLAQNGYGQYEISNFAKKGYECRHNLKYWTLGEYIGLGCASHSYFRDTRFSFVRDVDKFTTCVIDEENKQIMTDENYKITQSERVGEYIMLNLRLTKGISVADFNQRFSLDFESMFSDLLPMYVENGFMKRTPRGYAFTTKGMYVSNYILSSMLDFSSPIDKNIASGLDK